MIDIHCHILPGLDDGAANETIALEMARQAVAEGITEIVATPHHRNRHWQNPKANVLQHVAHLNETLKEHAIPLMILPGQEVRLFGEMAEPDQQAELLTVNNSGNYLLVEFPTMQVPQYASQLFFNLQTSGVTPVIVHPERNQVFLDHPDKLYQFINEGALAQITAASLIGKSGNKVQKRSRQFLENQLAHFIASDAHNVTERPFYRQTAQAYIEKEYGFQMIEQLNQNAEQLVQGKQIPREQPTAIKEKKFFGLF